jgi:flagellar hook-associated protein 3 FlgL
MRISTSQIYDAGVLGIQRNLSDLYKLQNQLSSGRRVLTPEDDPVAAAEALLVTQTQGVNAQQISNQGNATSQLGLVDSQLSSLTDLLQNVREKVVQAGNTTLNASDRASIATELDANLNAILGIANSKNGSGDYLFSGYRGATVPFAINASLSVVAPASTAPVGYFGDDGERLLQVSSSRQMAVNVAGSDVFMNAKAGNGTFATATGGNVGVSLGIGNTGTATADAGAVLNRAQWDAALKNAAAGQPLEIRFVDVAGVMNYGVYDPVGGLSALTPYTSPATIPLQTAGGVNFAAQVVVSGVPANGDKLTIQPSANHGTATVNAGSVLDPQKWALAVNNAAAGQPLEIRFVNVAGVLNYGVYDPVGGLSALRPYTNGQAISLQTAGGVDFGSQVVVNGQPTAGDTFTINASSTQSLFQTMQNLIGVLRAPVGKSTYSTTEYANAIAGQLTNLDQAFDNVSRVQASVGTRMRELDSLGSASSDLDVQYQASLSKLQDLDYAKAISDFTMQNTNLQAAQKSFVQISGLSLFNYL